MDPEIIIDALIRASRMFACATGGLVIFDSFGTLFFPREVPPHSVRRNAIAWAIAAGGTTFFGLFLLSIGYNVVEQETEDLGKMLIGALWFSWGVSFTYRAATRAFRPHLIAWSATMMFVVGFGLALARPAVA